MPSKILLADCNKIFLECMFVLWKNKLLKSKLKLEKFHRQTFFYLCLFIKWPLFFQNTLVHRQTWKFESLKIRHLLLCQLLAPKFGDLREIKLTSSASFLRKNLITKLGQITIPLNFNHLAIFTQGA